MAKSKLKIATCQFPISAFVKKNARYIRRQIREAAQNGADLVHFSEAALPGYVGNDIPSFEKFDWETLRAETRRIMSLAADYKVWLILSIGTSKCTTHRHFKVYHLKRMFDSMIEGDVVNEN